MKYFEAPEDWAKEEHEIGIFLAGGITNCADWQTILAGKLSDLSDQFVILNPRREEYKDSSEAIREQIYWEHSHMQVADAIVFWFCPPTLNPITLFEYGTQIEKRNKELFVGCDPEYARKTDIGIQTQLYRHNQIICSSLDQISQEILAWKDGMIFKNVFGTKK